MTFSITYVFIVLVLMIAALVSGKMRPGIILLSAIVLLLCGHIIDPKEAVEGFSNKGMITVGLLYLVSEGVRKSGMLERIIYLLLPRHRSTVVRANGRFLPVISALSAFLNNTPVVVIFAPMIKNWAGRMHLPHTKFLIPLSYATILGGMCTLIGTSTNIVLDGLIQDGIAGGFVHGGHALGMFELSKVGLFICLSGLFYLIMVARYLLPNDREADLEDYPTQADPNRIRVEAMLSLRFPGIGQTLREFDFYAHFGATVKGIRRAGQRLTGDWMNSPLTTKDTLILDANEKFLKSWSESRAFWMINAVGVEPKMGSRKRLLAVVLLVLMVIGATLGETDFVKELFPRLKIDMFVCAAITAVIMAWSGMFNQRRYTKFVSWDVLITIACAFGISKGMINSGFADYISGFIIQLADYAKNDSRGIYIMLAALYLITNIFTEVITNNAAAALAFPLAVSISDKLGCDPTPFFICICFAASASFSTPIGYQTNLIVQGIGGYRFTDFVRVGLPLNIIVFLLSVFLIPLFY